MRITLFTGNHCAGCQAEKDFLTSLGIPFDEVSADDGNFAIFQKYEVMSLPTLIIDDNVRIEGYAPKRIREALNV